MSKTERRYIRIHTPIPGPNARALLNRRENNVPQGPVCKLPTFAEKGEGAILTDVDGNRFIDFAGAIGTLNAGHRPAGVVEALKDQLDRYIHTCFNVMMYEPYIQLAEKLNEITPGDHPKKTFFLNSGAEAVENAVKLARKFTGRQAVVSFDRGFHGRTLLTMSLTSKVKPYKYGFGPFAPETYKLPYPYYYRERDGVSPEEIDRELLSRVEDFFLGEVPADQIAAVIMEPVQGEGGFIFPSKTFVQGIRKICREHGILFIADEVQTGFGRTGRMFGMEHYEVVPDLMTMSKSIAAGLPISAVTGRAEIMDAANPGAIGGTYGGSPLGCVAALGVIRMMEKDGLPDRAKEIGRQIRDRFSFLANRYLQIGGVRGLGAMCAFETVKGDGKEPDPGLAGEIIRACGQKGVILMGAGLYSNVIRTLCPLVITDDQLQEALDVIEEVVEERLN